METILTIDNLTKQFGKLTAVNNLSFRIEKGNVYGILGPNGSGKSTTLGIILNVVNKTSGSFQWFDGKTTTHQALKKVGAIIERPNFYPYMTAYQNLKLVCKIKEVSYTKIEEKLKLVGLWERKDDAFKTFSLGMKQRLAIGSALLNDPEILILDEPTNGLDPQGIHQIRELIVQIAQSGTTILLASHLLDEVEKVCSHVVVLQKGVRLYAGRVDQMIASYGHIEINAADQTKLIELLKKHEAFTDVTITSNGILSAILSKDIDAEEINRYLFKNNIIVNHLVKKKESLEEKFLQLTSKEA